MADTSAKVYIRPYTKEMDREAVAYVCRSTASLTIQNGMSPEAKGEGEVEPEPLVPHMDIKEEHAVGYIVCAPDTVQYVRRLDVEYIPSQLNERPSLHRDWKPQEKENETDDEKKARKIVTMLHYPVDAIVAHRYPDLVREYPAHLHILILGPYQSGGWGTKLIEALCAKLRSDGIPGIHLGANEDNHKAIKFYERMGFEPWECCDAGGRKGLLKDKISNEMIHVTGMCMVKSL